MIDSIDIIRNAIVGPKNWDEHADEVNDKINQYREAGRPIVNVLQSIFQGDAETFDEVITTLVVGRSND